MLIEEGPAVVLNGRACAWIAHYAQLSALRVRVRGTDPEISKALEEIHAAAMAWRGSATGTAVATQPEPATQSSQWLSTGQAADLAQVSDSAIRKAIREDRLPATQVGGRYRISREDIAHYRAARAA